MNLIDTHSHIHRLEFDADRDQVLERARAAGVVAMIDPATDFASCARVVALAKQTPDLFAAVGLHPQDAAEFNSQRLEEIRALAQEPQVVAIGEIGLDTYRNSCPIQTQKETFSALARLAMDLDKPMIIHSRETAQAGEGDGAIYRTLFDLLKTVRKPPFKGVLHCFSGSVDAAMEAIDLGLYISYAGNITFKKADAFRRIVQEIPFDRVVIETDAPFLAPQAFRGKRNEPAFVRELVPTLQELLQLGAEDVARVTTVNAHHLFGVGPAPERGKIAYPIGNSLYINLTNACTDRCVFCALSVDDFWKGDGGAPFVKGHHLRMQKDPTVEEILASAGDPGSYDEVVFCGYGEPVIRLKELTVVSRKLREKGARRIRLNTNGHGNLIHKRSIAPELKDIVDEVSVSLNTPNAQQYLELCRPSFGLETYESIKTFIRECRDQGIKVVATVVTMPEVDVEACRRIALDELKVEFRPRTYNDLG